MAEWNLQVLVWMGQVQKARRIRKVKDKEATSVEEGSNKAPARINVPETTTGSCFIALTADIPNLDIEVNGNNENVCTKKNMRM
jgi:hypothetical protein